MKTVLSRAVGGPETLVVEEIADPVARKGEVLIAVAACGVNYPDALIIEDRYQFKPQRPFAPGGEIAGVVEAVGEGVTHVKPGQRVLASTGWGGMAEKIAVEARRCIAIPDAMPFDEAAAFLMTYGTSYYALVNRGALKPGETLLIHGGSSGIGTMAIQLAKAFGSKVIVTVGSKDKADACLKLGADHAINYKTEDFVAAVKTATSGAGVQVILDMVGGDYVERNYDAAATDGRIVQIALLGGPKATVNFAKLMVKRLHHTGSTLRPRSNTDKAAMVAAIEAKVMPLLREGRIKPLMDSTFPLEKAADAHRRMETSEHIGKIVLAV